MTTPTLEPNTTKEDTHLDFKSKWYSHKSNKKRGESTREIAKDIASFANAEGGTIILGVEENKDSSFKDWCDPELPSNWQQTINQSISTHLHPLPKVHTKQEGAIGFIHIEASPTPISVSPPGKEREFFIPRRLEAETIYMSQEEIYMEISNNHRRLRLKIAKQILKRAGNTNTTICHSLPSDLRYSSELFEQEVYIDEANSDHFIISTPSYSSKKHIPHLVIPYEYVIAAWFTDKEQKHMRISLTTWYQESKTRGYVMF